MLEKVKSLCASIEMSCLGNNSFSLRVERDIKDPENGRVFIQVQYKAPHSKTGEMGSWNGRKFYLSEHMIEDEIVKTAYLAFKLAVEHEIMEGFKINGIAMINPHVSYTELLGISSKEISRQKYENGDNISNTAHSP